MHKIELSEEHLSIIGAALSELPFKVAHPVIAAIQSQISAASEKPSSPNRKEKAARA